MTPLAHRLVRQMNLPDDAREPVWQGEGKGDWLEDKLWAIHCFEVTRVLPLAYQIAEAANFDGGVLDGRLFCPAPRTWIEWVHPEGGRIGLLIEDSKNSAAVVHAFWGNSYTVVGGISKVAGGLLKDSDFEQPDWLPLPELWSGVDDLRVNLLNLAQLFLFIINSPKVIGRRQHMPHRGLERELVARTRNGKRFPLEAWSEIILEARPTYFDEDGVEHEAHLTGRKCLHFCRAHVRIRNGKMEIVGSHWRGDAALGIKKSRYKVVPPSSGPRRASTVQ